MFVGLYGAKENQFNSIGVQIEKESKENDSLIHTRIPACTHLRIRTINFLSNIGLMRFKLE